MATQNKVTLYLMTEKGYAVLSSIVENKFHFSIDKVIIGIDTAVNDDYSQQIENLCQQNNINWSYRGELDEPNTLYSIAVSWRWLINFSTSRLIVLHDSLLPKYRGFAPLVNQLINGEKEVGVTALFASKEYDRGPIISQLSTKVSYPIKVQDAISLVIPLYQSLVVGLVKSITQNIALTSREQDDNQASYSLWRDDEDYRIDWSMDSEYIARMVNAVGHPYKGAQCFLGHIRVFVFDCTPIPDVKIENRTAGKIIFLSEGKPVVVCGTGLLKINTLCLPDNTSLLPLKKFRQRFK